MFFFVEKETALWKLELLCKYIYIFYFIFWGGGRGVHLLEKDQFLVLQLLQKDQSTPKEKQDIASLRPIVCFKQFSS